MGHKLFVWMGNISKLPLGGFKRVENISEFGKDFIANCNEDSNEGHFLEVDAQYLEELHELHNLPFLPERIRIEKAEKLVVNLHDKQVQLQWTPRFKS